MVVKIKEDYEELSKKIPNPKFLVTLSSQKEAKKFCELFCQEEKYQKVVCLIISESPKSKEKTREFKNNDLPNIAIVVRMLTTGFDLPVLRHIYIGKKVQSASEFWQIISRVNRLAINKKVGHIIDFADNNSVLEEAKKKYFGSENLLLTSPAEAIASCLAELRQILNNAANLSFEAAIGYLLKNKKEKEFTHLVRKIEEIIISPQQIADDDQEFFTNCQKISVSLAQFSDPPPPTSSPRLRVLPVSEDDWIDEKNSRDIYDDEHYRLFILVEKLKKLQSKFLEWNISQKVLGKLERLISEYEERDPTQFDCSAFYRQAEANWKIMESKYKEIQENLGKDPNYLVKKNCEDYLQTNFSHFFAKNQAKLSRFLEEIVKTFSEKFHDDSDWFLLGGTYGDSELKKMVDKVFNSSELSHPSTFQEWKEIRKNIINIIRKKFYV